VGARCATGCVVVVLVVPVWLGPELDDSVEFVREALEGAALEPVEPDSELVRPVDPPPQPASATSALAAPTAKARERLNFRLARELGRA
jgi:hypothetical protein